MSPIRILTFALLLSGLTSAQVKTEATPPPKKGDGVAATKPPTTTETPGKGTPVKTAQDKETTPPAPPIDTTKLLEKSLEVARREHAFLTAVVKAGGLLPRFRTIRGLAQEMTETFTPELAGPAMPANSKARLLGDGEKKTLDADVVFTVEAVPVTQKEYDATLDYLRSYPRTDSTTSVESLAIAALIERKAGQGIHAKQSKVAHQIITLIKERVAKGEDFGVLAGQYSEDQATSQLGGTRSYLVRSEMDRGYAMATHGLKISQCSAVAESIDGFHIIRVLGIKNGETPDKDRIQTAHIVRYYTNDAASRTLTRKRIAEGKIDVAFRTDEMRALAPAQFK